MFRRLLHDLVHVPLHFRCLRLHRRRQYQHLGLKVSTRDRHIKHSTLLTICIASRGHYNFIYSLGSFLDVFEED